MTGFKVRSTEPSDVRSDCLLVSSIKQPLFLAAWLARITSTPRHRLRDLDPAELLLREFPDSPRRTCTALELLVMTCRYSELVLLCLRIDGRGFKGGGRRRRKSSNHEVDRLNRHVMPLRRQDM